MTFTNSKICLDKCFYNVSSLYVFLKDVLCFRVPSFVRVLGPWQFDCLIKHTGSITIFM